MMKKKYDEVSGVEEETPINEGGVTEPENPNVTEPLHEKSAAPIEEAAPVEHETDREVPDEFVSKRHASNHVVLGWLMDVVNSHPEAEAIRSAILAAVARSRDHGLLEVLDNVKAYIASHDRISGVQ